MRLFVCAWLASLFAADVVRAQSCPVVAGNLYALIAAANADIDASCIDLDGQEIVLDQGPLHIETPITILGSGGALDAKGKSRIFVVEALGSLTLRDAVVRKGRAAMSEAEADSGACILVHAGGAALLDNVTLTFCRFKGAAIQGYGGAVHNRGQLIVQSSRLRFNYAFEGGSIFNDTAGDLRVTNSTFFSNRSKGSGEAGIFVDGERAGGGSGVSNHGVARIEGSEFDQNRARLGQGGGALLNYGNLIVLNSTFSHNRARNGAGGFLRNRGTARLAFVTAGPNQGRYFSGNISNHDSGTVYATHTAVFFDRTSELGTGNCGGPRPISQGFNFESSAVPSCGFELQAADPQLASYRNYGGPTSSRPPRATSPLSNGGSAAACQFEAAPGVMETVSVDQRGLPRPVGNCEIGAVELQSGEAY